jgi:hypothetical protein
MGVRALKDGAAEMYEGERRAMILHLRLPGGYFCSGHALFQNEETGKTGALFF